MKIYGRRSERVEVAITCDRCNTRHDDIIERQEFLCFSDTAGYGNTGIRDMTSWSIDLCQYCVVAVLGRWIRIDGKQGTLPQGE